MNPTLEIFSQGEEVVTGQVVDSNAAWLAQEAVQIGFTVTRHTSVGDKLDDLVALLREISGRADCCLCTGGLGPTTDDLTAEAVSQAFGLPLEFDETAFAQVKHFFDRRNRHMPESNRKQAMLPQGSIRLDNQWGTAPGFALQAGRCWFVFMPGVPSEMRNMYLEKVVSTLTERFVLQPQTLITIKTIGIGESDLQQRIKPIAIPDNVQLGFRASLAEVQTKLLFPHDYPSAAINDLVNAMVGQIGDAVFAINGLGAANGDLISLLDQLMIGGKHTLAVVETVSQGMIASYCTALPWLLEARYQQTSTINNNDFIAAAKNIAIATQAQSGADFVLVQLHDADLSAIQDKDSAIVLYNVLLTGHQFHQTTHTVAGPGKRKQHQAALLALDLLRRFLQHKDL
ncbi:MAG: molybdopterin-binding protein [Methylococcaceae bacterium]|jgi:competence/damage-inducible protein CinA-like protein|nr:molybdopterin-binding protein [Methylococcaceae bacterium]MDZ4157642.1 molybdopterin-binding protein [Methylococcales bacterium]MDP2393106.1 molybdopterin-binding protein [Methylococcaceae bacterium]MDP3019250.1 molybdopterin-binding protein [Methylococcaceae bacterium]MDP3389169.1 molybdopterin-binding protein [Methylococcaceae bacterium]